MEKRIQLEMRGKNPEQVTELVLDNCRSTTIVGLTDDFVNLKNLSVSDVGLTSLKGFPKLPNLKKLELSENRISGGLNVLVNNSPNLISLNLSANKIDKLEAIEPFKDLLKLEALDLCQCDISHSDNYREKVFGMLPNLKYLDGFDKDEKEAYHSEEENGAKPGKSIEDGSSDLDEEDFDEEDEEDLDGEIDEEDEEGEVDLSYLEKENIDEESEGEDYSPEEEEEDEIEGESEEDDDESTPRGQKRKLDDTQD